MAIRIEDQITTLTKESVLEAFWKSWLSRFGSVPKKESIWVLLAQVTLETGLKSCHCWNLGNVKSREGDGYDYTYFACNEILPTAQAHKLATASPATTKITRDRSDGTSVIWFYPDHPTCRFRAFGSLLEGAADHLAILTKRFQKSWSAVLAGDPIAYAHALKVQGYYTADESDYARSLASLFRSLSKMPFDYDSLPVLSEDEKEQLGRLAVLTSQQMLDDDSQNS